MKNSVVKWWKYSDLQSSSFFYYYLIIDQMQRRIFFFAFLFEVQMKFFDRRSYRVWFYVSNENQKENQLENFLHFESEAKKMTQILRSINQNIELHQQ